MSSLHGRISLGAIACVVLACAGAGHQRNHDTSLSSQSVKRRVNVTVRDDRGTQLAGIEVTIFPAEADVTHDHAHARTDALGMASLPVPMSRGIQIAATGDNSFGSLFAFYDHLAPAVVIPLRRVPHTVSGYVSSTKGTETFIRVTALSDGEDQVSERVARPDGSFSVPAGDGNLLVEPIGDCAVARPIIVATPAKAIRLSAPSDLRCASSLARETIAADIRATAETDTEAAILRSVRGRHLIGIGESAHGTRELLERRIEVAKLVVRARGGGACLLMETDQIGGLLLDAYARGIDVPLSAALSEFHVDNLDAAVVARLAEWLRLENSTGRRLRVVGVDVRAELDAPSVAALAPIIPPACSAAAGADELLTCAAKNDRAFKPLLASIPARRTYRTLPPLERIMNREQSMARNVLLAAADDDCRETAILLAHNKHVSKDEWAPPSVGARIAAAHPGYFAIGVFFGGGSISARDALTGERRDVAVGRPEPNSLEGLLLPIHQRSALDLARLSSTSTELLAHGLVTRAIGATFLSDEAALAYERISLAYDVVLFESSVQPMMGR